MISLPFSDVAFSLFIIINAVESWHYFHLIVPATKENGVKRQFSNDNTILPYNTKWRKVLMIFIVILNFLFSSVSVHDRLTPYGVYNMCPSTSTISDI